jgi:two-component system, OmpR family, response regulator ChvI
MVIVSILLSYFYGPKDITEGHLFYERLKKILVVDDDPNITFTFKVILEKKGFQVDTYNDPSKAASDFQPGSYSLALLDIRMPKMDGFELYREIRKKESEIKVCFVTAFEISKDEVGHPTADGSVVFLRKPVGAEELADKVHNMISA